MTFFYFLFQLIVGEIMTQNIKIQKQQCTNIQSRNLSPAFKILSEKYRSDIKKMCSKYKK